MRVIVTGGAGFIGSALCRNLVAAQAATVCNIDKLTYASNLESLSSIAASPNYTFEKFDICDLERLNNVFDSFRPDAVIHLAAESHVDRSIESAGEFVETNIVGTYCLLEAARRYWHSLPDEAAEAFRFLHVSTDEVYGSLGPEGLFSEESRYDPSSPYSASKAAADHLVTSWHRTYGLPTIIGNSSNNYGPYHFPEKLIPLAIVNAIEGATIPVYGDGGNVRDWLYVEDHVQALLLILKRSVPGAKYNIGAHCERANLHVVQSICDQLDKQRPQGAPHHRLISFVKDRPGHDRRYAIDSSKLTRDLGWRPRESFETGLSKTVAWYLSNSDWWRPLRGGAHLQSGINVARRQSDLALQQ